MSPHPLEMFGKSWRTSEALFQAMRFTDEAPREEIRSKTSPMAAKWTAKRWLKEHSHQCIVQPKSVQDLENMKFCLRAKIAQHPELKEMLLATDDAVLIEDESSRRGNRGFWGAAYLEQNWVGENHLGNLWMIIRTEENKVI